MNVRQVAIDQWPRLSLFLLRVTAVIPQGLWQHFFLSLLFSNLFFLGLLPSISQLFPTKNFLCNFLARMKLCLVAICVCGVMKERQTFSFCTALEGKETRLMVI